jgi:hypothetical protein
LSKRIEWWRLLQAVADEYELPVDLGGGGEAFPLLLIPVPVTGIQPREVIRVKRPFSAADAALLD